MRRFRDDSLLESEPMVSQPLHGRHDHPPRRGDQKLAGQEDHHHLLHELDLFVARLHPESRMLLAPQARLALDQRRWDLRVLHGFFLTGMKLKITTLRMFFSS